MSVVQMHEEYERPATRRVWEVLADFANITEDQSRQICRDFMECGIIIPENGSAEEHIEMIEGIIENMNDPDIRETLLRGTDEVSLVETDEGDPFYYNAKLNESEINMYLRYTSDKYDCVICGDDDISTGGVQLSCSMDKKPCKAVFCQSCVVPWLTRCVSRCPMCRTFCKTIKNIPVNVRPRKVKKKPFITKKKPVIIKKKI